MSKQDNAWPKKITVDKRIVRILSGSTYSNFPSAIRELITNSYDADAEIVHVNIDLVNEIITVSDNGKGMNENDFAFYLRIAGKSRKKDDTITKSNRKIVGQFGVGFLSILPFCERYLIETKKRGSDEIVYATISSTEYFDEDLNTIDVDEIPIEGGIRYNKELFNEQFTRIRLVGFSKLARSFFNGEYSIKGRRNTKTNFSPVKLLKWELCEYLPLKYDDEDPIGHVLNGLINDSSSISFNVFLNDELLFRRIHANTILERSYEAITIGNISFKYVFLTDYKPIDPIEARHLMLRNLNVGVGERTTLGLGLEGKVYGKLAHVTGEVFITEGLNDLISVSRDKFNFSPEYEALKDFLRTKLSYWANFLDNIKSSEKTFNAYQDSSRVESINSIKKETFEKEIKHLQNKGFTIQVADNSFDSKTPAKIDHRKKEIVLPEITLGYDKLISFHDKEYKLQVKRWDVNDSFPAIRYSNGVYEINEMYPLFQEKNFDAFLKLNIILLEYFLSHKFNDDIYQNLVKDLTSITLK